MKPKRNNEQTERFRKAKKTEIKRAMKRSKKKHSEMFKKLAEH